jgi:hypothetical protein
MNTSIPPPTLAPGDFKLLAYLRQHGLPVPKHLEGGLDRLKAHHFVEVEDTLPKFARITKAGIDELERVRQELHTLGRCPICDRKAGSHTVKCLAENFDRACGCEVCHEGLT